ncbi:MULTISPECIES: hypothetical protein [Paenibacillus]|uniref:hypothetical protein n=1 Tax=Paenibacillus TaxID=44249 RepID=UPI00096EB47C|nr:hypothetical protein [Paenibacillus peoriae]OMF70346.1 hypothetical protein BK143_17715 [Paenibacillus peoriae]OMF81274.1 hypothetical protein BK145_07590 [Paenibacillus peoriae]
MELYLIIGTLQVAGGDAVWSSPAGQGGTVYILHKKVNKFAKCKLSDIIRPNKGASNGLSKPTINNIELSLRDFPKKNYGICVMY